MAVPAPGGGGAVADRRVRAEVGYVRNPPPAGAPTLTFVTEHEERSTMVTTPGVLVWFHDVREEGPSLDREGFALVAHATEVDLARIEEDPAVDRRYLDEVADLLRGVTGADHVIAFDAKKRFGEAATEELAGLKNAKPARYAHGDVTDASGPALAAGFLAAEPGLDLALDDVARWALVNVWRSATPPPQDHPLAVCDARTVGPGDGVPVVAVTELRGVDDLELEFETTGYVADPAHRWCWFPDMTPDEVLVFVTHDSDPARPHRVAHTAFTDPTCPPDVPTRASVEARALVLFR